MTVPGSHQQKPKEGGRMANLEDMTQKELLLELFALTDQITPLWNRLDSVTRWLAVKTGKAGREGGYAKPELM